MSSSMASTGCGIARGRASEGVPWRPPCVSSATRLALARERRSPCSSSLPRLNRKQTALDGRRVVAWPINRKEIGLHGWAVRCPPTAAPPPTLRAIPSISKVRSWVARASPARSFDFEGFTRQGRRGRGKATDPTPGPTTAPGPSTHLAPSGRPGTLRRLKLDSTSYHPGEPDTGPFCGCASPRTTTHRRV